jgi:ATP-dependent Clp protease ATP-binding subunit ClpA
VFERFTDRARHVVVLAQEEARTLGHGYVGTEHLLLALIGEGDGVAAQVLASAGVTASDVRSDVRRIVGRGLPASPDPRPGDLVGPSDADALRAIGIDVDSIRERIEASFGPGALELADRSRRRRRARRFGRHRLRTRGCAHPAWSMEGEPVGGGHVRFTPRSKKVLELSLRETVRLHHGFIGTEHILLGLLREGEGLAAEVLVGRGADLDDLRRRVLVAIGKVA